MIEKTGNYQAVANVLGHKDPSTTFKSYVKMRIYTDLFDFITKDYEQY